MKTFKSIFFSEDLRNESKSLNSFKLFVAAGLFLIIIFNSITLVFTVLNSALDHDEFQHLHIAWNVFNGKIIYKDFFEHHGPIYPFLNSLIFSLFHLEPVFNTVFVFRFISMFYAFIILFLTFKIGKEITNNFLVGLFSTVFLFSLIFFQESNSQIRPDGLQNVLWLLGVFITLRNIEQKKIKYSFFSGVFFGLSVLTNAKVFIGPASIFVFYILLLFVENKNRKLIFKNLLSIIYGILLVFFIVSFYFIINNGFSSFLFYNYEFNIVAALKYHSKHVNEYLKLFLKYQTGFLFLTAAGTFSLIYFYGKNFLKTKNVKADEINKLKNKKLLFLLVVSIVTSSIAILGLYQDVYLIFLPFLSIAGSFGIIYLYKKLKISSSVKRILFTIIFIMIMTQLLYQKVLDTDFHKNNRQLYQKNLTNFVLKNTERSEPLLFIWSNCGGYVFNADLQFYWCENENFRKYYKKITGYDVFGGNLINKLKEKNVRYLVGYEKRIKLVLSKNAYSYVKNNFVQSKDFDCLWKRKF